MELHKLLLRHQFGFCSQPWTLCLKQDWEETKRVQTVKRLIKALKSFPYVKSLESFKLTEKMKKTEQNGSDINVTAQRK